MPTAFSYRKSWRQPKDEWNEELELIMIIVIENKKLKRIRVIV